MARIYGVHQPAVVDFLYTVDQAVGPASPNRRDDVLLVQFFLKALMTTPEPFQPPGEQPIQVDGIFGRQTETYIKFYQQEDTRRNPGKMPLKKDGRVDSVQGGSSIGSISHTLYTIIALNLSYQHSLRRETHKDISKDPNFPPVLGPSLFIG
jgi:hypothetical protein